MFAIKPSQDCYSSSVLVRNLWSSSPSTGLVSSYPCTPNPEGCTSSIMDLKVALPILAKTASHCQAELSPAFTTGLAADDWWKSLGIYQPSTFLHESTSKREALGWVNDGRNLYACSQLMKFLVLAVSSCSPLMGQDFQSWRPTATTWEKGKESDQHLYYSQTSRMNSLEFMQRKNSKRMLQASVWWLQPSSLEVCLGVLLIGWFCQCSHQVLRKRLASQQKPSPKASFRSFNIWNWEHEKPCWIF